MKTNHLFGILLTLVICACETAPSSFENTTNKSSSILKKQDKSYLIPLVNEWQFSKFELCKGVPKDQKRMWLDKLENSKYEIRMDSSFASFQLMGTMKKEELNILKQANHFLFEHNNNQYNIHLKDSVLNVHIPKVGIASYTPQ